MESPRWSWAGLPAWIHHGARSGQGSKTAAGGECVFALVLDGEHGVLGLIGQSKPAPSFFLFFYIRTTSRASLERHLAMECSRGFRWLPSFVSPCCRHRQRFRSG